MIQVTHDLVDVAMGVLVESFISEFVRDKLQLLEEDIVRAARYVHFLAEELLE